MTGLAAASVHLPNQWEITDSGTVWQAIIRKRNGCAVLFFFVWLGGWSVGVVMMIQKLVVAPTIWLALSTPLFVAFWFGGMALLLWTLWGQHELKIDRYGLTLRMRLLIGLHVKTTALADVQAVVLQSGKDAPSGVMIVTEGDRFGVTFNDAERDQVVELAGLIREQIANRVSVDVPLLSESVFPDGRPLTEVPMSERKHVRWMGRATRLIGAIFLIPFAVIWNIGTVSGLVSNLMKGQYVFCLILLILQLIGLYLALCAVGNVSHIFRVSRRWLRVKRVANNL